MRKIILPLFIATQLLTCNAIAAELRTQAENSTRIELDDLPAPESNPSDLGEPANLAQDSSESSLLSTTATGENSVSAIVISQTGNPLPESGFARAPYHITPNPAPPIGIRYLTPQIVSAFYGINAIPNNPQGAGQTIAIIDAYHAPNIANDLNVFSKQWGLPLCNSNNPCFKQVYAAGTQPPANASWAMEISLDVEWAHAVAPKATIMLVEANSNSFSDLLQAVDYAVKNGATVVSMSFGGSEFQTESFYDFHFDKPNVIFTASSGDNGDGVEYPAASPYIVAVGGTTIDTNTSGAYLAETAWSGSGGGISRYEPAPSYQQSFTGNDALKMRGVPDVAYGADPNVGFYVYDSYNPGGSVGWWLVGGTSAGAPQWAALFATANSVRDSVSNILTASNILYDAAASLTYSANYHDITTGTNGGCGVLCSAAVGYDYVTGLGSPVSNKLVDYVSGY